MGLKENNLKNKYERTLTRWQRLFRVNAGQGWTGRVVSHVRGVLTLAGATPFYGMPAGTPDMIGFDSVVITEEMVGKRVAIFVGAELKATRGDKLRPEQKNWRDLIVNMGGVHKEVRYDGEVIESSELFKT